MVAHRFLAWFAALCVLPCVVQAQISRKNLVLCRQLADRVKDATKPFVQDAACALDVLLVASPGGPDKDIKFYFQVNRTEAFEPALQYEIPSNNKTQLAAIDVGYVGIVANNFDPAKISTMETITFINSSQLYRKNFSDVGVETLLDPKTPVSIKEPKTYKAVGWFRVMDKANITHEYVAVRDNVEIKATPVPSFPNIVYDEKTTYCWRVQNQTAKDGLVYDEESFDSNCPVAVNVSNPLVATNLVPFQMTWAVRVVPNYLGSGGKGVYDLGAAADAVIPILHSSVHICAIEEEGQCHMFNPKNYTESSEDQTSGSLSMDPAVPPAAFSASSLKLTKGQYVGFVHGIVKKADGTFLHFATYFQIKVDEKASGSTLVNPIVAQVPERTYCWLVYAPPTARNVSAASAIGAHSLDDSCPLSLALSSVGQATTNAAFDIRTIATQRPSQPNLVTVATLPEGFNISMATISYCKNSTDCGPFKAHGSTFDLQSSGRLQFKQSSITFPEAGTYSVYLTATVNVGKGVRLDASVVAKVIVQDAVPATSNTTLYIAIIGGVVGLLLIAGIVWCCITRRRKARWDRHRLERGAMNYKDPAGNRVHSVIPMVNQRGGITEVPRMYSDDSENSQHQKLDLAVSHYMYNQDAHRVDEMPPRRVTSQYDPRSSLGYDPHQEDLQHGYDDYYRPQPQRTKSRGAHEDYDRHRARSRGQDDYDLYAGHNRSHQLVIRDEYQRNPRPHASNHLVLGGPQRLDTDEYVLEGSTSNVMSPSSVHNNYGGYSNMSYDDTDHHYRR